jgi:hypothetical protein
MQVKDKSLIIIIITIFYILTDYINIKYKYCTIDSKNIPNLDTLLNIRNRKQSAKMITKEKFNNLNKTRLEEIAEDDEEDYNPYNDNNMEEMDDNIENDNINCTSRQCNAESALQQNIPVTQQQAPNAQNMIPVAQQAPNAQNMIPVAQQAPTQISAMQQIPTTQIMYMPQQMATAMPNMQQVPFIQPSYVTQNIPTIQQIPVVGSQEMLPLIPRINSVDTNVCSNTGGHNDICAIQSHNILNNLHSVYNNLTSQINEIKSLQIKNTSDIKYNTNLPNNINPVYKSNQRITNPSLQIPNNYYPENISTTTNRITPSVRQTEQPQQNSNRVTKYDNKLLLTKQPTATIPVYPQTLAPIQTITRASNNNPILPNSHMYTPTPTSNMIQSIHNTQPNYAVGPNYTVGPNGHINPIGPNYTVGPNGHISSIGPIGPIGPTSPNINSGLKNQADSILNGYNIPKSQFESYVKMNQLDSGYVSSQKVNIPEDDMNASYIESLVNYIYENKLLTVDDIFALRKNYLNKEISTEQLIHKLETIKNKHISYKNVSHTEHNNYNVTSNLTEDFYKPLGDKIANEWSNSYTILNTDKWQVPVNRPPICINNNADSIVYPSADSSYYINLENWDNSRYVMNKPT